MNGPKGIERESEWVVEKERIIKEEGQDAEAVVFEEVIDEVNVSLGTIVAFSGGFPAHMEDPEIVLPEEVSEELKDEVKGLNQHWFFEEVAFERAMKKRAERKPERR